MMSPGCRPGETAQQAQATGLSRIYQAAGDMIVYEGGEPYRWAAWPEPPPGTSGRGTRTQPSELLRAANALIDFTGRHDLLADLRRWREDPVREGVAVHLIHGPGGQGKTRLADHLARMWQREGWVVLAAHHRRDRSAPQEFQVPDLGGAAGVLVVVDYAERWDTADLLSLLADTRIRAGLPVRVLLLARPAGTWWQSLEGRIQRDLRLTPTREELKPLEREAGITRAGLFTAARDRFAQLLEIPAAATLAPPPELERHEAHRLVLSVHMAALAAVLACDHGDIAPADPVQFSELLLARERDHWEAMCAPTRDRPLRISPDAMGQVVYTATMTGRLDYAQAGAAVERVGIESREHPGQLLKDHAVCYPPAGPDGDLGDRRTLTVLEPLYPDRLGEDFIALSTPGHPHAFPADPWAQNAPARLLAPLGDTADAGARPGVPVWARHGPVTLIEAARRWPDLAETQVYPLLAAHPQLALHAGGAALATLADLPGIDPALLERIESVLPAHRHIDLDVGIAAVAARLAEHRLAVAADPADRARIHDALAVRLSYAGLHTRALAEGHQAVQIRHRLVEANRDAYLPGLAMSLSNHAVWLAGIGRRVEAVQVGKEAVLLC
ncbi:hypothetical protein ACIBF6_40665 [Streptosporangium amethystogenes]|uniref:hypothetical protein n=1 Tax=Streptosporangium amethystogenes TaxID=2002 RepID=UPI0037A4EC73